MSVWMSVLKADPIPWLLEDDNPGVKHMTLTSILDKPETDPEVKKARAAIMREGMVPKILSKQKAGGYWETPDRFYTAKYKGTSWQLIILAELGADSTHPRVRKACEFILSASQDPESGGFSFRSGVKKAGGLPSGVVPCLTGNMVWSLIKLGFGDDPRVAKGIDWIVKFQRFDDGIAKAPKGGPMMLGRCAWESTPAIWAWSSLSRRSPRSRRPSGRRMSKRPSNGVSSTCSFTISSRRATTWTRFPARAG